MRNDGYEESVDSIYELMPKAVARLDAILSQEPFTAGSMLMQQSFTETNVLAARTVIGAAIKLRHNEMVSDMMMGPPDDDELAEF